MLFRSPLVVLDTETTGLPHDPDAQPWEVAAVLLDREGEEIDRIEAIGYPAIWRPDMARIVALGGMDADRLLAGPPLAESIAELSDWFRASLDRGARLSAFNVAFDRDMLSRIGIAFPSESWAPCVMERAKPIMGEANAIPWMARYNDWKMPKLSEAAAFFQVPQQEPAHRALADARTAALVAVALQRRALAAREAP